MTRYKLTLEYDGRPFVGWQRQDNGPSVQQAVEDAIRSFSGEEVKVYGSGRTDAGVHALGQIAHFDLKKQTDANRVREALNFHLTPDPVSVLAAEATADEFHARFDAVERRYLYRLATRRAPLALDRGRAWHVAQELDAEAMDDAAQVLVGKHDFTTFRAAQCQAKSPVKTLSRISVSQVGDEIHLNVAAPSFLHHQVRSFTGSLKLVGEGKWRKSDLKKALEACDRSACGIVAPPEGLYLSKVLYPRTH